MSSLGAAWLTPARKWSVPGTANQLPEPSGCKSISDLIRSGYLEQETVEGQGDMMRAFWKKYGVELPQKIKQAYGVE